MEHFGMSIEKSIGDSPISKTYRYILELKNIKKIKNITIEVYLLVKYPVVSQHPPAGFQTQATHPKMI